MRSTVGRSSNGYRGSVTTCTTLPGMTHGTLRATREVAILPEGGLYGCAVAQPCTVVPEKLNRLQRFSITRSHTNSVFFRYSRVLNTGPGPDLLPAMKTSDSFGFTLFEFFAGMVIIGVAGIVLAYRFF